MTTSPDPAGKKPRPTSNTLGVHRGPARNGPRCSASPPVSSSSATGSGRLVRVARTGVLALAIGAVAVTATVGTLGVLPARAALPEATPADKVMDLGHLGIGLDGLLAAGLSINQALGVTSWIGDERARFSQIRLAKSQLDQIEQAMANLRERMVRTGRTQELTDAYAAMQSDRDAAKTAYDGLVTQARAALSTHLDEELNGGGHWATIQRVMSHREYRVPTAFKVLDLSTENWERLERYLELIERHPEGLDQQTLALGQSLQMHSSVTNAQQRISSDLPVLAMAVMGG